MPRLTVTQRHAAQRLFDIFAGKLCLSLLTCHGAILQPVISGQISANGLNEQLNMPAPETENNTNRANYKSQALNYTNLKIKHVLYM